MEEVCSLCNSISLHLFIYLLTIAIDLGKVLAGIQVPPSESVAFDEFLEKLGYPYVEETDNEVYKRYLRA